MASANKDIVVKAMAKRIPLAPNKGRLVIDAIRGQKPEDALTLVSHMPQKAAKITKKLLTSLIANAENNLQLDIDDTVIALASVDTSIRLKRIKPRARGRADRILKRYCNITLGLADGANK